MGADGRKTLLAIIEAGGYPNFSSLYEQAGLDVTSANSMRKALVISKKLKPDVVIAEFNFGPTYGSRISNLETLFAGLQRDNPRARLIVFIESKDQLHLQEIESIFPVFASLVYPIDPTLLSETVHEAVNSEGRCEGLGTVSR